jgi:putative addiction module component (TIGR02574 family)
MTPATQAVLAEALRLDPEDRTELAIELLGSLEGPSDADADGAWALEIERRVEAIEAGTVNLEPWEDIRRRIEHETLSR